MKIFKFIFSRFAIVSLAITAQVAIYVLIALNISMHWPALVVFGLVGVVVYIKVMTMDVNPMQQILWGTVLLLLPIVGLCLYFLLGEPRRSKRTKERMRQAFMKQMPLKYVEESVPDEVAGQINYLKTNVKAMPYSGCDTQYFKCGEDFYASLIEDLRSAKKFIFMEFYIIERGEMWDSILEILSSKVKEGVEVRLMYDDVGSVMKLPTGYHKRMREKGISCVKFNTFKPFVTNLHNHRDHRKIVVIDGEVGYTGGINLADEYINRADLGYYWKDTGVRIHGNAVSELLEIFLQLYEISSREQIDFSKYATQSRIEGGEGGLVVPFGTGPGFVYGCPVAQDILINAISTARREIIITTPYLIMDYAFNRAVCSARARGVDVKIIIPGVPDKKMVYILTKHNALFLQKNGVQIFLDEGSFVHAKSMLVDGEIGIVGTINCDYRSMIYNFENAVWMYRTKAVEGLKQDVCEMASHPAATAEEIRLNLFEKLVVGIIRIFSPLF